MAPTEAKILNNYLVLPAQLPTILSLEEFIAFFPRQLQGSPQIRSLYRDLQAQRNAVVDSVAKRIEAQVKKGKLLRREVIAAKRQAESRDYDPEIEVERMLFGAPSDLEAPKHTVSSILPGLEDAISELEGELRRLEEEESTLLASVQQTVGNLSDLRYGRLGNSQLPEQVLDGLVDLQETCKAKN
ncbi:hypothetical protein OQA88_11354 [Cercophora sp. LCS_1]